MNRYILQQKFFTLLDRYEIKDDRERVRFTVKSKFFTIGKKFWICTPDGKEIYLVKQRLMRLLPRYDIYQGEQFIGKIKKRLSLFVKRLKVTTENATYKVKGNVFAWDFKIIDEQGNIIGNVSKSVFKIADRYTVDAYANDPLILAIALAMDAIFHPKR